MLKQWIEVEGHVSESMNVEMHRKLFCFSFFLWLFFFILFLHMNHLFISTADSSNEYCQSLGGPPELI